ncbi:MAG: thrombospondin type 3 repeat-containing protein, partial [Phycisphaeraceae bacterium]
LPIKLGRFMFALAAVGAPAVAAPPAKVEICHVPSGATIEVTQSALAAHLAHGDYLGPCAIDNCPNDPDKTEAGQCGCGTPDDDADGDGTADCNDTCLNDVDKLLPGLCGCGNADTDSDADGTSDCIDGCPNDTAKDSPGDCGCGAVDEDLDEDGISDCIDTCPADANADQSDADGDGIGDVCDSAPSGGGGAAPAEQQADDDPTLEDDSSDAVDSEDPEHDDSEEEVDPEQTDQAVQESEEDSPSGLAKEADEPEAPADKDDDGDGVQNQFDECPNTALAARVDVTGCVADFASEDGSDDGLLMLAPPGTNDLDDEASAGVCGQGLGLLELSCMLSFAVMFGASGRRRSRRVRCSGWRPRRPELGLRDAGRYAPRAG